jgi:hypothetical protein
VENFSEIRQLKSESGNYWISLNLIDESIKHRTNNLAEVTRTPPDSWALRKRPSLLIICTTLIAVLYKVESTPLEFRHGNRCICTPQWTKIQIVQVVNRP